MQDAAEESNLINIDYQLDQARLAVEAAQAECAGRNVALWLANCRYTDLLAMKIKLFREKRGSE